MKAKLSQLIELLEQDLEERYVFLDRETGRILTMDDAVMRAAEREDPAKVVHFAGLEEEPMELARAILDDVEGRFIRPPDRIDFDEYGRMEDFCLSRFDPGVRDELQGAIKGSGVPARFKSALDRLGLGDEWRRYRDAALKTFAMVWCEEEGIEIEDDTGLSEPPEDE